MSEWREVKLIDFMQFNPSEIMHKGTVAKKIAMENIEPFNKKVQGYVEAPFNGGTKFKNGDTLVARITPCLENGKTAYVDFLLENEVAFGSTEYIVLREKKGISNSKFIFYLAISGDFRDTAIQLMTGTSGRQRVETDALKERIFILPPLPEQKAIAEVLSCLDDKIDFLNRQNKTLESLAESYFKQWFIEEVQEDWEVASIDMVANIQNGYSFSSKDYIDYTNNTLEVFKMGHISPDGGLRAQPKTDFVLKTEKLSRWVLKKEDIVMAMTDMKDNVVILAVPALIDISDKYVLNQRVARITLKNDLLIDVLLLYYQMKSKDFITELQSKANSGVQVNLTTESIKNSSIYIPHKNTQKYMVDIIRPIYDKVHANASQIKTINKLRDTLLPKLINGDVKVKA